MKTHNTNTKNYTVGTFTFGAGFKAPKAQSFTRNTALKTFLPKTFTQPEGPTHIAGKKCRPINSEPKVKGVIIEESAVQKDARLIRQTTQSSADQKPFSPEFPQLRRSDRYQPK